MTPREHAHPKFMRWFRYAFAIFAFGFPIWMVVASIPGVYPNKTLSATNLLCLAPLSSICILVAAYFWQDIWMDEEGLLIEFLWMKIRVRWNDIVAMKPAFGFIGPKERRPLIVLVTKLTPFHRVFGVLYGWSIRPGFIIFPTINDFQSLKKTIQNHIKK